MITHIFKDGTTSNDITGHLVKRTDCPTAYKVMEGMNEHKGKDAPASEQGSSKETQEADG